MNEYIQAAEYADFVYDPFVANGVTKFIAKGFFIDVQCRTFVNGRRLYVATRGTEIKSLSRS